MSARPEAGIVYGKDDDVKEDADAVDDQGQEDGVLAESANSQNYLNVSRR